MIETRPAMSDTRCREDRLRGRGDDGEREGVGRKDPDTADDTEDGGEFMRDSEVGVVDKVRAEKAVGVGGRIFGDVLMNAWLCLGVSVVSKLKATFDPYPNSERVEHEGPGSSGGGGIPSSSVGPSQSKPLPMDVTAQLPTLAVL